MKTEEMDKDLKDFLENITAKFEERLCKAETILSSLEKSGGDHRIRFRRYEDLPMSTEPCIPNLEVPTGGKSMGKLKLDASEVVKKLESMNMLTKLEDHIDDDVIRMLRRVLTYGDISRDRWEWVSKGAEYHIRHALDHFNAEIKTPDSLDDSGLPHLAHAIVRLMFALNIKLNRGKQDEGDDNW